MLVYNEACLRSQQLALQIRQEIERPPGFISFARFMELALYAPGLGYYAGDLVQFGRQGDYCTSPEISHLFAHCMARQYQQILTTLPDACILEIGAGSGAFAKALLLFLEKEVALPKNYFIFEISKTLRERQKNYFKAHCPHLLAHIIWLDTLDDFTMKGVIFANEVLDAMPQHYLEIKNQGLVERNVTWHEDRFIWKWAPLSDDLTRQTAFLSEMGPWQEGHLLEVNLSMPAWIQKWAHVLEQGILLLCDYGYGRAEYYHPDRYMGTLQCYYQHRRHDDPLRWPGLQDITAHVDFTAVVESALSAGCFLAGYTTQSGFLLSSGLLELADCMVLSDIDRIREMQAIKMLLMPAQMGEAIKVMAVSKLFDQPLIGFSQFDRSRDL